MKKRILSLLTIAILASSCQYMGGKRVHGNGHITSKEQTVSSFKNVQVSGAIDLFVPRANLNR